MRVGSGVILFQLAGFLTSALADFYFAKHIDVIKAFPDRSFQKYGMDEQQAFAPPPAALIAFRD